MLITHVARPLCLRPCDDRRSGGLSSGLAMVSSCEGKLISPSDQQASQRDHMRGAGCTIRPGLSRQECVYISIYVCVCVCVCSRLVSAYFMVVCEKQEVMTGFHVVYMRSGRTTQNLTGALNDFSTQCVCVFTCEDHFESTTYRVRTFCPSLTFWSTFNGLFED